MSHEPAVQVADDQVIDAPAERVPYEPPHEDEGHSIAGWIGVVIMLAGFALGAVALFFDQMTLVWVGVGLVALGAIIWPILRAAGLGPKQH